MEKKRRKARKPGQRKKTRGSRQEALLKALIHPVRAKALTILSDRTASPSEIAQQIDVSLGNVSYHVRMLEELGLIEIVEEELVRGSVAHFYRAVERPLFDNSTWEELDPTALKAVWGQLAETLLDDAAASLVRGYFDKRPDRHSSRRRLLLDEKGWRAVAGILANALDHVLEEQSAAAERLKSSGDKGILAILAMFCFEIPPDPP
jgi:DNA-binding transcriptional ArsR family regulator